MSPFDCSTPRHSSKSLVGISLVHLHSSTPGPSNVIVSCSGMMSQGYCPFLNVNCFATPVPSNDPARGISGCSTGSS